MLLQCQSCIMLLRVDHEQVQVRIPTPILSLLPPPCTTISVHAALLSLSSCLLVAISVVQCDIRGFYHHRPPIIHCLHHNFRKFGENGTLHTLFLSISPLIFLLRTVFRVSYTQGNHIFVPRSAHISRYTGQNRRERRDVYQASALFVSYPFSHLLFGVAATSPEFSPVCTCRLHYYLRPRTRFRLSGTYISRCPRLPA